MGNPSFEDASSIKNGGFPASYVSFTRRVKKPTFPFADFQASGVWFQQNDFKCLQIAEVGPREVSCILFLHFQVRRLLYLWQNQVVWLCFQGRTLKKTMMCCAKSQVTSRFSPKKTEVLKRTKWFETPSNTFILQGGPLLVINEIISPL